MMLAAPVDDELLLEGPSRDIWAAAAVRETFRPHALLESWLQQNPDASKEQQRDAMRAALDLQSLGKPSVDAAREPALKLSRSNRAKILKRLGPPEALRELAAFIPSSGSLVERTLATLLKEEPIALNQDSREHLVALDTVVPWVEAAGVKLPFSSRDIRTRLNRLDFLRTLAGADLHRFVGRDDLRRTLENAWRQPSRSRAPILIEGPGGIGKSTAVGRFIADLIDSDDSSRRPDAVFHIDFDRPSMQQARPVTVLLELWKQASSWWISDMSGALVDLSRELLSGYSMEDNADQHLRSTESTRDLDALAHRLLSALPGVPPKLILFVDTFERVDGFDDAAASSPARVADLLTRAGAEMLLIYAARSFKHPRRLSPRSPIRLKEFLVREADTYLSNEAQRAGVDVTRSILRQVREAVGRSPLALRLAVGLLAKGGADFDVAQWGTLARNSPEQIQAVLYDRFLLRIKDPELRKIARPGLLVRRLTADVIAQVLAGPCELSLKARSASELLEAARSEGQLFTADPADAGALQHRQDVRSIMLPNLDASIAPELARQINEAAVAFYMERGRDVVHRAEELYHRLRLDQDAAEIDPRWTEAAGHGLKPSMHELPLRAQSYLRSKLSSASFESLTSFIDTRIDMAAPPGLADAVMVVPHHGSVLKQTIRELRLAAGRMVQSGDRGAHVIEFLKSRSLARLDAEAGDVFAQALLLQDRHDELIVGARAMLSKPTQGDPEVPALVLATAAGVLEGRDSLSESLPFWLQSLSSAKRSGNARVELPSLIGCMRVRRKLQSAPKLRLKHRARSLQILEESRGLREQRVLAREAGAELSEVLVEESPGPMRAEVEDLVSFVVQIDEAFPSTVDDPQRLREIGRQLQLGVVEHRSLLGDLVVKMLFSGPDQIALLIPVLRAEVDWTLARAAHQGAAASRRLMPDSL